MTEDDIRNMVRQSLKGDLIDFHLTKEELELFDKIMEEENMKDN